MRQFRTAMLAACVLILLAAGAANAQTAVVNPTMVQFTASADDARVGLDGAALVTRYELRVYVPTALMTLVVSQDLGKPTPAADGTITAALAAPLMTTLVRNTAYVADVAAIGPSGEGVSDASNPFGFAGPPAKPGAPTARK